MGNISTTKISSKGQVVIPEKIRNELGLTQGTEFIVVAGQDAIILKTIQPPSPKAFTALLKKARTQAKQAGLKKTSITKAIKKVRA